MSSPKELLITKCLALHAVDGFPGHVFVIGNEGDIYIINVFTMSLHSHKFGLEFEGFVDCKYSPESSMLTICDSKGRIIQYKDSRSESNNKYKLLNTDSKRSQGQRTMLKFCRNDLRLQLKFDEEQRIGGRESFEVRRLRKSKVLAFNHANKATETAAIIQTIRSRKSLRQMESMEAEELATKQVGSGDTAMTKGIVVAQDQIEQVIVTPGQEDPYKRLVLKEFTEDKILVFAQFVTKRSKRFLVCVNLECTVLIYDVNDLEVTYNPTEAETKVLRVELVKPVKQFDLFEGCRVTDYHKVWVKDSFSDLLSDFKTKEE